MDDRGRPPINSGAQTLELDDDPPVSGLMTQRIVGIAEVAVAAP